MSFPKLLPDGIGSLRVGNALFTKDIKKAPLLCMRSVSNAFRARHCLPNRVVARRMKPAVHGTAWPTAAIDIAKRLPHKR